MKWKSPLRLRSIIQHCSMRTRIFRLWGGIGLARCKKVRGKADEANEALEQVETRYPGYGPAVQGLKKSWK